MAVVLGGKQGEVAHCTMCGQGLVFDMPQPVYMASAMMTAFDKHHKKCKVATFAEPKVVTPEDWFRGRDVGTSSYAIFFVMTGTMSPHGRYAAPLDPNDFGRCYRLLKLFPEWRPRLAEVARLFPKWGPMVERWDEMTALYERELPSGRAPLLYDLMEELNEAGILADKIMDETAPVTV